MNEGSIKERSVQLAFRLRLMLSLCVETPAHWSSTLINTTHNPNANPKPLMFEYIVVQRVSKTRHLIFVDKSTKNIVGLTILFATSALGKNNNEIYCRR